MSLALSPDNVTSSLDNPLLEPWSGAYGGVPGFAGVQVQHFKPALEHAMAEGRSEILAIADNPAPPTFENTCAAFENAGRTLRRVRAIYGVWQSSLDGPEFQAVNREMAPKLSAYYDEVIQNTALFHRIQQVYRSLDKNIPSPEPFTPEPFSPEQRRLVWNQYTQLVKAGAKLNPDDKAMLGAVNQRLATLYTTFSQNVLSDEEKDYVLLESESDLAGLPESLRSAAATAAAEHGFAGKWLIANTRSSVEPFLTFAARRDLRERVFHNFIARGDNGGAHDNNEIVKEILRLRAQRAKLLGYPTYAHWSLQDSMAKTPQAAIELMQQMWTPALARVQEEVRDMEALAAKNPGVTGTQPQRFAAWDYRYYAEKVRKEKYDLDENEIKPYLELNQLREALFWVAGELFGLEFTPVSGLPVFHPDVLVWAVSQRKTQQHVGLWYFDPYARPGKHSGAWMSSYREQEAFVGEISAIVSNNSNFMKPAPGQPTLLSWDDAITLFHEFGHALHGLSSKVRYPSLSGTDVARDFVEFPSQLLEHWLATPEVLNRFALHYQTRQPIPAATLAKIQRALTFNQGFKTAEYLVTALVDMKLHLAADPAIDPRAFEKATLQELQVPPQIVMRHRIPQLSHVFADDAYAAGYYSYLWADVLTADAYEGFVEGDGPYDRELAARLATSVFEVGNTVDPGEAYRAFRGQDPSVAALLRKRGFPVPAQAGVSRTPSSVNPAL